ncbi:unnamed protein product [Rotaria magnacalcarata]|uniref:BK channel n=1 Tax=Rotaria magnacalcarata TaxID=392030 RepID=A0A816RFI9_9BILA|nr:unnamed protein product [Rotaria magnacalcarata]
MTICPACSPEHSNKSLDPLCNGERIWTTFLFTSFGILLGGWIIIFIYEVLSELCVKLQNIRSHGTKENTRLKQMNLPHGDDAADYDCNWLQEIKSWDNNIISGQTKMGKTFVTIIFLCSIASLILYCLDTQKNTYMESCTIFRKSISMQIDLGLNAVFLVYFILRFAVAKSKRRFWFSLYSIVDIFTISPSFLAFYLNRTWMGFRFLRALPLMSIPNILQYMGVIERPRKIRIAQLASKFIALLLTASGFVHLVENSGDFFCDYCNAQELDAFNAVYFMIITMTTADKATACLIIANKECQDASSDDSANIMRVISLKNFNQRIRIILQLLQYHNKLNVASIPGWNMESDEVICIAELKLGLIGMSCIVTGFATMTQAWSWRDLYHRGAGMKLYLEELPPSFYGKSFAESALVCFKLGVMLLAIEKERKDEHGNTRIAVDVVPCDDCIIIRGSRAFIVCMSSEDANRVKYYCSICYPIIDNLTELQLARMRVCFHARSTDWVQNEEMPIIDQPGDSEESEHAIVTIHDADVTRPLMTQQSERICTPCYQRSNTFLDEDMSSFDSTGMFYFTPSRNIQDAVLDVNSLREYHNIRHRSKTVQDGGVQCKHPLQFRDPIDSNVQYVEQGHTDEADLPFFLTTPFASGT